MKKSERNAIVRWAESATDEELEKEYYDCVFSSLGSQTENMHELGYDLVDIKEREQYEMFLCQKSSLLEELCQKRSIELWKKQQLQTKVTRYKKILDESFKTLDWRGD